MSVRYPKLYQINTRLWLGDHSRLLQRPATLDDIPNQALDQIASLGFDWVWLLGIWQTGAKGREIARRLPELRKNYREVLSDLRDEDIPGSCFAISAYSVPEEMGGEPALGRLRSRLQERGLRLMLDFVPNHTAQDHPWVFAQPEYYIQGDQDDLKREPGNYVQVEGLHGRRVLAHGRDPYFPGWSDTLQLNYGNAKLQQAMQAELMHIAQCCDGVRCDMAMLVLPEVFHQTWGIRMRPFWPRVIPHVKQAFPGFVFMAEVYWDLEATLQQQGFDYTYDKRLYDRLRVQAPIPVLQHMQADLSYQDKLVRFLENHDEPRAAAAFPPGVHQAAALVTYLAPGLRFFHQGQLEGFQKRVPVQLNRAPKENSDPVLQTFYLRLLELLQLPVLVEGDWQLVPCAPAWEKNPGWQNFIVYAWQGQAGERLLVAVNYAPVQSQCYVKLPAAWLQAVVELNQVEAAQGFITLEDQLVHITYQREIGRLLQEGLYLDMPAWGGHVFKVVG
ncbi:MAG: alpha-amylase family glycosyl hydrolase [Anaerolineales bacterium]|jgi:hypothetical protein|nr:alpha-amylase family glycosyl hydrolase [Anaerolineales bacterium]